MLLKKQAEAAIFIQLDPSFYHTYIQSPSTHFTFSDMNKIAYLSESYLYNRSFLWSTIWNCV